MSGGRLYSLVGQTGGASKGRLHTFLGLHRYTHTQAHVHSGTRAHKRTQRRTKAHIHYNSDGGGSDHCARAQRGFKLPLAIQEPHVLILLLPRGTVQVECRWYCRGRGRRWLRVHVDGIVGQQLRLRVGT